MAKEKTEHQEDKVAVLDLQKLAEKIKASAVLEVRRDFRDLAYRLFSVELVLYGIIKGEKNLTDKEKRNVLLQQDILKANVENILNRMEQIDAQRKEEKKPEDKK